MPNWKDPRSYERLLAAMVAANDMKLDYRKIASMYGEGATYDSIEGRFRLIRKAALDLKTEIDTGAREGAPARNNNKNKTDNNNNGVKTEEGTSSAACTPSKKKKPRVKQEEKTPTKKSNGGAVLGGRVGKVGTPLKGKGKGGRMGGVKEEVVFGSSEGSFGGEEEEGGWGAGIFENGDGDGDGVLFDGMEV
ncbi:hypothetical protein MMC12_000826 [Toensbergia leucococca]|nr:hypothetical protein [Toensbergia leucococca]